MLIVAKIDKHADVYYMFIQQSQLSVWFSFDELTNLDSTFKVKDPPPPYSYIHVDVQIVYSPTNGPRGGGGACSII